MPLTTITLQQPNQHVRSLKYSAAIPPNPQANLSGWFDRVKTLWSVRRWLQLHGSMLFYSHSRHSTPQWRVDLRECQVVAGRRNQELSITRPDGVAIYLFAPTIDEYRLWFAELKRVSDSIFNFYDLAASISRVRTGSIMLARDRKTSVRVSVFAHDKQRLPGYAQIAIQKRDHRVISATQTHPSLLCVIDVFETVHTAYVVTEVITGGSLHDTVLSTNAPPMSIDDVRNAARELLSALAHLHTAGIVHGAVDEHSIVCTRRNSSTFKLMAYGFAFPLKQDHYDRLPEATARAPEVVCFQKRSPAADIFAAGSLIFKILTRHPPFPIGDSDISYLSAVSHGPSGVAWTSMSDEPYNLLRKMLEDDASNRPTAVQCLHHKWFTEKSDPVTTNRTSHWQESVSEMGTWEEPPQTTPTIVFEMSSMSGDPIIEAQSSDDEAD